MDTLFPIQEGGEILREVLRLDRREVDERTTGTRVADDATNKFNVQHQTGVRRFPHADRQARRSTPTERIELGIRAGSTEILQASA